MGLIKRPIGFLHEKPLPRVEGLQPQDVLPQVTNDVASNLLEDLSCLLKFANQLFDQLLVQTTGTAERIGNLRTRLENCERDLPQAEGDLSTAPASSFYSNPRATFCTASAQMAQVLTEASRDEALLELYDQCLLPPNFSPLDPYAEVPPCRKRYTNPDFFIDEWLQMQNREREKILKCREKRHPSTRRPKASLIDDPACLAGKPNNFVVVAGAGAANQRNAVAAVGKLKKTQYDDLFGHKLLATDQVPSSPSSTLTITPSRVASNSTSHMVVSTMVPATANHQTFVVAAAPRRAPAPPPQSNVVPRARPHVASFSGHDPAARPLPSPTLRAPPPTPFSAASRPAPVATLGSSSAATSSPTAFSIAPPPPGPPPPAAPSPPPAPPSPGLVELEPVDLVLGGEQAPTSGIQDTRSSLLEQITARIQRKNRGEEKSKEDLAPDEVKLPTTAVVKDDLYSALIATVLEKMNLVMAYSDDEEDESEDNSFADYGGDDEYL